MEGVYIFFLETPIWVDNLDEYARLHDKATDEDRLW